MSNSTVFLDLDGPVIPDYRTRRYGRLLDNYTHWTRFNSNSVDNLMFLLDKYQAKIVSNSTHNSLGIDYLVELFNANGLGKYLLDNTQFSIDNLLTRGLAVDKYVKDNNIQKYAIFDDDLAGYDRSNSRENLIHTNGISSEDIFLASKLLKKQSLKTKENL